MPATRPSPSRRIFLMQVAASGALVHASAHAQSRVDESDENAIALGYKHDTTKVDNKKYPQHKPDQRCDNCQFWQGSKDDAWAGCAMFGRKQIAKAGWCTAWRKV